MAGGRIRDQPRFRPRHRPRHPSGDHRDQHVPRS